jgi:hypothetical protein
MYEIIFFKKPQFFLILEFDVLKVLSIIHIEIHQQTNVLTTSYFFVEQATEIRMRVSILCSQYFLFLAFINYS